MFRIMMLTSKCNIMKTKILVAIGIFFSLLTFSCNRNSNEIIIQDSTVVSSTSAIGKYPIVSTGQTKFYDTASEISTPSISSIFYRQDASLSKNFANYKDNGDGTISDLVTGLMWEKTIDKNNDGKIDAFDKMIYTNALNNAKNCKTGGYTDWRLPTIKELYSLINFSGIDPSGYNGTSTSGLTPFIDIKFFNFNYGDISSGERIIDAQYASSTKYVTTTMFGDDTVFGVNFADGRIKGYGTTMPNGSTKKFYVLYVRGNTDYGKNNFKNNGDGTITDQATGLMWMQNDSVIKMDWEQALTHAKQTNFAGHNDWRLPTAKELNSILDYSKSPSTTNSASIDAIFNATKIKNEAGNDDYGYYWTSTSHVNFHKGGNSAAYFSFGRAMGFMGTWIDVHGAGAQRSDPKVGNPSEFLEGFGPQGDAIRIYNMVRLVRNTN